MISPRINTLVSSAMIRCEIPLKEGQKKGNKTNLSDCVSVWLNQVIVFFNVSVFVCLCRTTTSPALSPQATTVTLSSLKHQENGPREQVQLIQWVWLTELNELGSVISSLKAVKMYPCTNHMACVLLFVLPGLQSGHGRNSKSSEPGSTRSGSCKLH